MIEAALVVGLVGSWSVRARDPRIAVWRCHGAVALVLACVLAAMAGRGTIPGSLFPVDALAMPMLPVVVAVHLIAIPRLSECNRPGLSPSGLLRSLVVALAVLTCREPRLLVVLMAIDAALPLAELRADQGARRGHALCALLFGLLLVGGWGLAERGHPASTVVLLGALLLRAGAMPLCFWTTGLFERASLSGALLHAVPLVGVVAALRLALPVLDGEILRWGGFLCLGGAVAAATLAAVQNEARRWLAFLCVGQGSLVMFGVLLHSSSTLTAGLCLWLSVSVALAGLGFVLRALEARFGRLSLREHGGHYVQAPALAVGFLLLGLTSAGFPGTLGFVPAELIVSGSADDGIGTSLALALAAMLHGIAVLRAYFRIFTGRRPDGSLPLGATLQERVSVVALAVAVVVGGLLPQSFLASRHGVADQILSLRAGR